MNSKTLTILYWASTLTMCAIFTFSAGMYLTKYEMVSGFFVELGFPIWLIYPLAVAKLLGVVAVLSRKQGVLTEWAYAGFFFDAVLAILAHGYAGHGWFGLSFIAAVLVLVSRFLKTYR